MPLDGGRRHGLSGIHCLHEVEREPLAAAGGYHGVRHGKPRLRGLHEPRKQYAVRRAERSGKLHAFLPQRALAREDEHHALRQPRRGVQQQRLVLSRRELRRVEQHERVRRDPELASKRFPRVRRHRVKARKVHAESGHERRAPPKPKALRQRAVIVVHREQQIRAPRHEPLRQKHDLPLEKRTVVVKEVPVHHVDELRARAHAERGEPCEKRRERGVRDDEVIALAPQDPPQHTRRAEVVGRGHFFMERHGKALRRAVERARLAGTGNVDLPAGVPERAQIGLVEMRDMPVAGCGDQNLGAHGASPLPVCIIVSFPRF